MAMLSTTRASRGDRRLAAAVAAVTFVVFVAAAPWAKTPLLLIPGFIPLYEGALIVSDFVTAALLFGQFAMLRSRALLVLASGYLFAMLVTIAHVLTFPGLFSPTGWLGAGPQSTAWLYLFWHGGFPLAVIGYAAFKRQEVRAAGALPSVVLAVVAAVGLLTLLATAGERALPAIMDGSRMASAMTGAISVVCGLVLAALAILWARRPHTVLDLWLMVVMCAWLCDVALSAVLNAGRFDLGFYVGRVYGLLAAGFVLAVMLVQTVRLYGRLAASAGRLTEYAETLEARVRERTVALTESERSFHDLFENGPLPQWVFDPESLRFLAVNDAAIKCYGFSREEFLAMRLSDIRPPEDAERLARVLREIPAYNQSADWRHRLKDGRIIDVDIFSHSLIFGRRAARMVVAIDVTARRAAHLMNQRIFETSVDVILVVDPQGQIIQVSPSVEATLGYRPEEWVGRSAAAFLYPPDLESTRAEMRAARRGRGMRNFQTRYVHKDGRVVLLSWTGAWSDPDQRHFFTGHDMTERLAAEEQLRQSQKMEAVGQLTGGLAHDFNNLLLVIIGNIGLLRELRGADREVEDLAREAHDAARRGADLTRSLLAFSRRQALQPKRADVNDLVSEIMGLLGRTLGEKIEISLDLAPDAWPVVVDPIQLEAALANLATNARDAMPKGGRLMITTANRRLDEDYISQHAEVAPGDYTMLQVTDNGVGMSADVLTKVFEPFFTTKPRGEGTGLGLSMVFGFMKQSGGHINLYSEVGVGTTFRLYLPRDRGPDEAETEVTARSLPPGRGERLLVVEDNAALRRLVLRQVDQLGYRADEAENAAAALSLLEARGPFDLLFTDIVMAGKVDGFDLARIVLERWPDMKIVMTSGFPGGIGADGHGVVVPNVRLLSKPYLKEDLARTLREVLDGHGDAARFRR